MLYRFTNKTIPADSATSRVKRYATTESTAMHNNVVELERVRILNIRLENLAPGEWRAVDGDNLAVFLSKVGIK
ncbi:MAG: hypothetical protein Q8L30_00325 [bacterium]|nr:hypothetical protein [bacterium]